MAKPQPHAGLSPQALALVQAFSAAVDAGNVEQAEQLIEDLAKHSNSKTPELDMLMANYRLARNQPKLALKHLSDAAKKGASETDVSAARGQAQMAIGRYVDAEISLRRALKGLLATSNYDQLMAVAGEIGTACLRQGQIEKALASFSESIDYAACTAQASVPVSPPSTVEMKAATPNPILYLPLEVRNRELDSKMLLALFGIRHGFHVVIGQKWAMQECLPKAPPGFVLFKTMNGIDRIPVKRARQAGHYVVGLDEEAFGRQWSVEDLFSNVDANCIELVNLLCAQNEAQVAAIETGLDRPLKSVRVTGNPRSDLYRGEFQTWYAQEAENLRAQHGSKLILVNSMSGNINPSSRPFNLVVADLIHLTSAGHVPASLKRLRQVVAFEGEVLRQYPDVVSAIARAFPDHTIIFRPHPVEEVRFWEEKFRSLRNVRIVGTHSITTWLNAVEASVFVAGCTTGLEAVMANVPAIRFIPTGATAPVAGSVTNELGVPARTPDEVVAALHSELEAERSPSANALVKSVLGEWQTSYSSENIAKACRDSYSGAGLTPEMRDQVVTAMSVARTKDLDVKNYNANKFPEVSAEDVSRLINRLADVIGISTDGLRITQSNESVFHLERL
jgi:surface carbohydrate biosynthesis protein